MKLVYILLVFTQLFHIYISSLLPFWRHPKQPRKLSERSSDEDFHSAKSSVSSDECDCAQKEEPDCSTCATCSHDTPKCNLTLPAPKKVINPYKQEIENMVPPKPFGSFCIKCAACLAVASQIEQVIKNTNKECETDKEKQVKQEQELERKIKNLCEKGFRNYDLRFFKNHSIITDVFKCTTHMESGMDGNWTKKLRELCSLYVSRINIRLVSNSVIDTGEELTNKMCRGTGIFRDCSNLEAHQNIILPSQILEENCDCIGMDC